MGIQLLRQNILGVGAPRTVERRGGGDARPVDPACVFEYSQQMDQKEGLRSGSEKSKASRVTYGGEERGEKMVEIRPGRHQGRSRARHIAL